MRSGLFLPIFDDLADPRRLGELAAEAEAYGWHGVFVWDHVLYRAPVRAATDPWIAMACIAMATSTIQFGPMVTPVARRRPQIVARQIAALDQLSGGRFVFGAGLGLDASGGELSRFGEETDDRRRAAMLDEGLHLITALLSGDRVDHVGEHYTAGGVQFEPTPVRGRVPVWVAARWPNRRPITRAARHDGLFIIDVGTPSDLAAAAEIIDQERVGDPAAFDVVVELADGENTSDWERAGATWCLASFDPFDVTVERVRERITRGPLHS